MKPGSFFVSCGAVGKWRLQCAVSGIATTGRASILVAEQAGLLGFQLPQQFAEPRVDLPGHCVRVIRSADRPVLVIVTGPRLVVVVVVFPATAAVPSAVNLRRRSAG